MRTVIINGGNIDYDFALSFLKEHPYDYMIAADRGMEFLKEAGICPDEIVGDFDSAADGMLEFFSGKHILIRKFRPQKDATDMEIAMETAIERGSTSITVFGATGSRMDHVLGSLRNLTIPLKAGVECCIIDKNNRIRLVDHSLELKREEQFGTYISLLAFGGAVEGLSLTGFFYPLTEYRLEADSALGVSNEMIEDVGTICFQSGRLLVVESKD